MNTTQLDGPALIAEERYRQINVEGWTPGHDDRHATGEMLRAGLAYGWYSDKQIRKVSLPDAMPWDYPWGTAWWKPSDDPIRNLVKAGALIAAEIDRLLRQQAPSVQGGNEKV